MTIDLNATSGSVDLTSPPTPIGSVTPVAVTSTIFTASPANNTSSLVTGTPNSLTGSNAQSLINLAQTWDTTGIPSALALDITDTASNAGSMFASFAIAGSRKTEIRKSGGFYTYNAFTDDSNNESGFAVFGSNIFQIGTTKLGTGTARGLGFYTNGTLRAQLSATYDYGLQTNSIGFSLNGGVGMPFLTGDASGFLAFNTAVAGSFSMRIAKRNSDPSAPAANTAHFYVKDNGSGKLQLAVLFPTGAVQILATEP
jgi:hypothetical protein